MVLGVGDDKQQIIDAIAFNVDTECWPNPQATKVAVAYKLDVNDFRGKQTVQLLVDHISVVNTGLRE